MCDIMERIVSQERAEEKNETAKRLIMKHTMSAEEIAEITELPLDVIIKLKNSVTDHT
jgi:hypothetical protein